MRNFCRCTLIGHDWERQPDAAYILAVCRRKCCRGTERGLHRVGGAPRPDVSNLFPTPSRWES